jgi:hypothetical protein
MDCQNAQFPPELLEMILGFLGPYAARKLAAASRFLHSAYMNARWHTVEFLSAIAPRPSGEQIIQLLKPGQLEHSLVVLRLRLVTAGCRCWNGAELRSLRTLKRLQILEINQAGAHCGLDDETVVNLSEIPSLLSVALLTCSSLTARAADALLAHPRLAELRITVLEGVLERPPAVEAAFDLPRQHDGGRHDASPRSIVHAMIGTCPSKELLRVGALSLGASERYDERCPTPPALLLQPLVLATCVQGTTPTIGRLCLCKMLQHVALSVPGSIVAWALRELLGGLLPLRTLKLVGSTHAEPQARADCLNALSPPPPTLRGLELIVHDTGHAAMGRDRGALEGFLQRLTNATEFGSEDCMGWLFIQGLDFSASCRQQLRERWPEMQLRQMDTNSGVVSKYEVIGRMAHFDGSHVVCS